MTHSGNHSSPLFIQGSLRIPRISPQIFSTQRQIPQILSTRELGKHFTFCRSILSYVTCICALPVARKGPIWILWPRWGRRSARYTLERSPYARKVWEDDRWWTQPEVKILDLLVENVSLVEEENHGLDSFWSGLQPWVLEDCPEESHWLLEAVDRGVFHQGQVVLSQGGDEDDWCNILKAVDPEVTFIVEVKAHDVIFFYWNGWIHSFFQAALMLGLKRNMRWFCHHFRLSLLCPPTSTRVK